LLRATTRDDALVAALQRDDWSLATLDEKDRALLNFAQVLNANPSEMSVEHINRLRSESFTDENIFDAVMIVSYFNFINRVADGMGLVPEAEAEDSQERHLRDVMAAR
jgi:alkylhydroperoxidase family enzyme